MELAKRLSATAITSGMLNSPNRKVKLQNTDCSHVLPPHQILMLPVQPAIRMKFVREVWQAFFAEFCFLSGFLHGAVLLFCLEEGGSKVCGGGRQPTPKFSLGPGILALHTLSMHVSRIYLASSHRAWLVSTFIFNFSNYTCIGEQNRKNVLC